VSIIDQNPDAFRRLGPTFSGSTVTGVGFDRSVLMRAGWTGPTLRRRVLR
jgi:trk system potassium uptake protein TrkA